LGLVQQGSALAREVGCDLIVAMGGGSAIDAGKAIAALLANPGNLLDYLEVIGEGRPLPRSPAPFVAIPTTAGTGAEVTRNAVLASPEHRVKVSLRGPSMLPRLAVVDPDLTLDLPPEITASTGLDALTQLIEPYVCARANPVTDALCRDAIPRAARSLRRACEDGRDRAAREDMSLASLCGGLALANAGLGAVHGFAAPIGGMYPAPHGAVCAALLAPVMCMNLKVLRKKEPGSSVLGRYEEVARWLTGRNSARAEDGADWVEALCAALKIPRLGAHGMEVKDIPDVCEKAARASSMKANPVPLSENELSEILRAAL
jgi:alcohol dehydrogenase class IV